METEEALYGGCMGELSEFFAAWDLFDVCCYVWRIVCGFELYKKTEETLYGGCMGELSEFLAVWDLFDVCYYVVENNVLFWSTCTDLMV